MKEYRRRLQMQISALVPEIFKFEKCVKYANEILMMSYAQPNIISGM